MRLILATAVIVGHSSEMIDGSRAREPLTRIFGSISLAELAVDAFFIISGYLISQSYLNSQGLKWFVTKRVARLYPGFLVACGLSIFLAAPLAGGPLVQLGTGSIFRVLMLDIPNIPGVLPGLSYHNINGALWTISIEARCYALVAIMGKLGLLKRPGLLLCLAAMLFAAHAIAKRDLNASNDFLIIRILTIDPWQFSRLAGHFLIGAAAVSLWSKQGISHRATAGAAIGLFLGLQIQPIAELSVAIFGTVLLFAAIQIRHPFLQRLNDRTDISYGTYLYGWPVMSLLLFYGVAKEIVPLALLTLTISMCLGWLSWTLIEAPVLRRVRKLQFTGKTRDESWISPHPTSGQDESKIACYRLSQIRDASAELLPTQVQMQG